MEGEGLLDKYQGGMVGMAICDALGTTLEFQVNFPSSSIQQSDS